jgi:hypothetical protein
MVFRTTTGSRTSGCSAQTATARRRPTAAEMPGSGGCKKRKAHVVLRSLWVPGSSAGRTADSESACRWFNSIPGSFAAPSSRGLGCRPLTAVTRVRIPLGLNFPALCFKSFCACERATVAIRSPCRCNKRLVSVAPERPFRDAPGSSALQASTNIERKRKR